MLNLMFNFANNNTVWIWIIIGIVLIVAVLAYVYYRITKKSNDDDLSYDYDTDIEDKNLNSNNEEIEDKEQKIEIDKEKEYEIIKNENKEKENTVKNDAEISNKVTNEKKDTEIEKKEVNLKKETKKDSIKREVLVSNEKGDTIELEKDQKGMKYIIIKNNVIMGTSSYYQTKPGLLKGLKSLANYKDTVLTETIDDTVKIENSRFEISLNENNYYGYILKTKNQKEKLSGQGFKTKTDCINAIAAVKNINKDYNL